MTDAGPAAGDGPDPQRVAAAIEACPSVARMHAGPVASYLPGKRVPGISVGDTTVDVHVDLAYPATVMTLAGEVRASMAGMLGGRELSIHVDDVDVPEESGSALDPPQRAQSEPINPQVITPTGEPS